ncbi:TIGR03790 family protein [Actimicrobium antarcticum]|uniref:TIGR03790 family protein n=1 Tax=Actimicrobium antarcticum TaxID=1051899 RepID=UPI0031D639F1
MLRSLLFALLVSLSCVGLAAEVVTPHAALQLQADQLAVIINDADPLSVQAGEYYREARQIPAQNIIHVRIPGSPRNLSRVAFAKLKQEIDAQLTPSMQAMLMIWTAPYAVECNSITSAMTLGFDAQQCIKTCAPGKPSPYYNAITRQPFTEFGIRPSMLLPTESFEQAKALIDRGVQSGFRVYPSTAYYLITADKARNSRAAYFPPAGAIPQKKLVIKTLRQDSLIDAADIMVYQTGAVSVPHLETLRFQAGALADHLTSAGGDLLGKGQMSSLRWLDAGATASYGSVSEPCNYWQKFPNSSVLLKHYLAGETAIEAYWKSVGWPAQGVFIGEPLAAPYR